jgi:RNA-directed DNA polymerase
VVASEAFGRIDTYVFEQLWRMLRQRHQNKSKRWLFDKYWTASGRRHVFAVYAKTAENRKKLYQVQRVSAIGIRRYVKIKADANPYLPEHGWYFAKRRKNKENKLLPAMSAREFRAMAA